MLRDSVVFVVVVAVVRTHPRAITLPMTATRKSIRGFPFPYYMSMGLGSAIKATVMIRIKRDLN